MTASDYEATAAASCTTTTTTSTTTPAATAATGTSSSKETNKQQQQQQHLSIEMPKFRLEMLDKQQQSLTNGQLKKWVWEQYQQELFQHLMVALVQEQYDESSGSGSMQEEKQAEEEQDEAKHNSPLVQVHDNHIKQQQDDMQQRLEILETVSRVQRQYLPAQGPQVVYQALVDGMIQLMHCEYGFIGQVLPVVKGSTAEEEEEGQAALSFQSHAVASQLSTTDVQLLQATHEGTALLPFSPNLDSLWERVFQTNAVVLTNNNAKTQDDNAEAGTPSSSTAIPLHNFLGLPVQRHDGSLIGMIGLVNRSRNDGFCASHVPYLQPFLDAASNVITAHQQVQQHTVLVNTLEQKVQERTQKLSLANQRLAHANERVLKASAMRLQLFGE